MNDLKMISDVRLLIRLEDLNKRVDETLGRLTPGESAECDIYLDQIDDINNEIQRRKQYSKTV